MARHMWGQISANGWAVAVACGVLASGCMAEGLPPVVEDEPGERSEPVNPGARSLADALGDVSPLAVAGSGDADRGSLIRVEAGRAGEVGAAGSDELELAVLGGYIDVRAIDDENVAIRDFVVDIDDVELPSGLVSADVRFTGVKAQLLRPETFEIEWGEDGERAEAVVALDLSVDWGVSVDGGEVHPLAPVKIEGLEVILELSRGDRGGVRAQVAGFRDGVFYEWGGMVELRGLAMDVRAEESAP